MKRAVCAALLAVALLAPAAGAEEIEVAGKQMLSPRLTQYTLRTSALASETVVRVLLPRGYEGGGARRYPVLYLLHGCCDNDVRGSQAWTTHGEAEQATEALDLIVVMPDAGKGGFYADWFNGGRGGPPKWETYHVGQLIPWADRTFRTVARREGRVIAGLSMGGFGTMSYAARHPDMFVAAAAYSGSVDLNRNPALSDGGSLLDAGELGAVFGPRIAEEVRVRGRNPWDLAENLRGLALELRTGAGPDPLEFGVHDQMASFHQRLAALRLDHVWDDYGTGSHTWPYWARDLRLTLPAFMRVLANPPPPPARVTYTAIEPSYEVYGWRVRLARPVLEFSRLDDASRSGFVLSGSGKAKVLTPGWYRPRATFVVAGTRRRADSKGRLHVPVDLGPANTAQQFRLGARTHIRRAEVRITRVPRAPRRPTGGRRRGR